MITITQGIFPKQKLFALGTAFYLFQSSQSGVPTNTKSYALISCI